MTKMKRGIKEDEAGVRGVAPFRLTVYTHYNFYKFYFSMQSALAHSAFLCAKNRSMKGVLCLKCLMNNKSNPVGAFMEAWLIQLNQTSLAVFLLLLLLLLLLFFAV